jgi:hypothetical protein
MNEIHLKREELSTILFDETNAFFKQNSNLTDNEKFRIHWGALLTLCATLINSLAKANNISSDPLNDEFASHLKSILDSMEKK